MPSELQAMTTAVGVATADIRSVSSRGVVSLSDLCGLWKKNGNTIRQAGAFLQKGKVSFLFIHISLPGFLREVGNLLTELDKALKALCGGA